MCYYKIIIIKVVLKILNHPLIENKIRDRTIRKERHKRKKELFENFRIIHKNV